MLKINIVTIFPQFFDSPLKLGILGRCIRSGFLKIQFIDLRDFTTDKHKSVDDTPFGSEEGMVMKYEPLKKAILSISKHKVFYLSPQGKKWNHIQARFWAESKDEEKTLVCGRYSGVDQRFITECVNEEISVGDYVMTGGEPAALVILDSVCRFIDGALGDKRSSNEESFEKNNLLEGPQWTRPRDIPGYKIPSVILSGHHQKIRDFQYLMSVFLTARKRPDLLNPYIIKNDLPKAVRKIQDLSSQELKACGITLSDLEKVTNTFGLC